MWMFLVLSVLVHRALSGKNHTRQTGHILARSVLLCCLSASQGCTCPQSLGRSSTTGPEVLMGVAHLAMKGGGGWSHLPAVWLFLRKTEGCACELSSHRSGTTDWLAALSHITWLATSGSGGWGLPPRHLGTSEDSRKLLLHQVQAEAGPLGQKLALSPIQWRGSTAILLLPGPMTEASVRATVPVVVCSRTQGLLSPLRLKRVAPEKHPDGSLPQSRSTMAGCWGSRGILPFPVLQRSLWEVWIPQEALIYSPFPMSERFSCTEPRQTGVQLYSSLLCLPAALRDAHVASQTTGLQGQDSLALLLPFCQQCTCAVSSPPFWPLSRDCIFWNWLTCTLWLSI